MFNLFIQAIYYFLTILTVMIVANAVLSWFPTNHSLTGLRVFIHNFIEPVLAPIRRMIQRSIFGGSHMAIDFSPFIAYLIISAIQRYLQVYMMQL